MSNLTFKLFLALIEIANRGGTTDLGSLIKFFNQTNDASGRLSLHLIESFSAISIWCDTHRLPPLTAVVVDPSTGISDKNFWALQSICIESPEERKAVHAYMLKQVYHMWGSSLDSAMMAQYLNGN